MTDVFISPSSQWANQFAGGTSGVEDSEGKHMRDIAPLIHSLCQRNGIDSHLSLDESLYARVQESNRMATKLHFALHSNAGGTAFGASTWVYTLGTKSEVMARAIQRRLAAITPWSDLGTIRYNHYETRETTSYAVIAEVAFHDKVIPAQWIRDNKRPIAIACTQGIIDALAAAYGGRFVDIAARPLLLDGGTGMAPVVIAPTPTPAPNPATPAPVPDPAAPTREESPTMRVIRGIEKPEVYVTDGITKRHVLEDGGELTDVLRITGQASPELVGQWTADRIPTAASAATPEQVRAAVAEAVAGLTAPDIDEQVIVDGITAALVGGLTISGTLTGTIGRS